MTLDVYRGRKTTMQQQQNQFTVYGMYDFTVLILIKSPVLKDTPASFPTNINLHEFLLASLDWVAHWNGVLIESVSEGFLTYSTLKEMILLQEEQGMESVHDK